MSVKSPRAVFLSATILGVATLGAIAPASAAPAKNDIKNAGRHATAAVKDVGEAGKNVGIATAKGAKEGAKAFKRSLTGGSKPKTHADA